MNTLKIGQKYGLYYGLLGLVIGFLIFTGLLGGSFSFHDPTTLVAGIIVTLVFSWASMYFGGRAAKRIHSGKNAFFEGGISSIYTLCTTIILSVPLIAFLLGPSFGLGFASIPDMIFIYLIYSVFFGGLPAILIGFLFGAFVEYKIVSGDNIEN